MKEDATECVTDLDKRSEMIMFWVTFEESIIFEAAGEVAKIVSNRTTIPKFNTFCTKKYVTLLGLIVGGQKFASF